jgi:chromosome segregation ATPase
MATKAKASSDVLSLRKIVQEQAIQIADLTKNLQTKTKECEEKSSAVSAQYKEKEELRVQIEKIHDLIDSCPNTIPRLVERKTPWGGTETKEQDILVRLASWLGATRAH